MNLLQNLSIVLIAYGIGSIPTVVLYSKWVHRLDIREWGDGDMGARNTRHILGFRAGLLVAVFDILKGALVIWLTAGSNLTLGWQVLAAAAVILGHDFPVFAGFRGGQGLAVTVGVFMGFFPLETLLGFILYAFWYLILRNSDISAGIGAAAVVIQEVIHQASFAIILFSILALLFIPFKKWLDKPRREALLNQSKGN